MPKLYFRYATMTGSKTFNVINIAKEYELRGHKVLVLKPNTDTREGKDVIRSRVGLERKVDIVVSGELKVDITGISALLCDEAQFLTPDQVDVLRTIAMEIPVFCYGLRTDFRTQLFPGSKRLMEVADSIEEIKALCSSCGKKAIFNMRVRDEKKVIDGPVIDIGAEDKYKVVCCYHYSVCPIAA